MVKNLPAMQETCVWSLSWEDLLEKGMGKGKIPTPVFWPREFYGQRSLAGYSPWGCKESDFTEQLSLLVSICRFLEFFICIAKPPLVFCPVISVSSSQTWLSFFFSTQQYSHALCGGIALVPWSRATSKQKVRLIKELLSIISSIWGTMSKNI